MSGQLIDAHIHLYATAHLPDLSWIADLSTEHILNQQTSVNEYTDVVDNDSIEGFIFVETDRKSSLNRAGWRRPLEEVEFAARIARGTPKDGEGHTRAQSRLLLGMVAWAPIPAGPAALSHYLSEVKKACDDEKVFALVKGFRYLLQDKPPGTMTDHKFIAGLQWAGDNGYTFDLCVDFRSRGQWQLQEALETLTEIFREGTKLNVIIDHFAKPDMCLAVDDHSAADGGFVTWSHYLRLFASFPNTYMKLSGLFSQLPPQDKAGPDLITAWVEQSMPWVQCVFSAFGASRIMFGSDWPVCQAEGNGTGAWKRWQEVVNAILNRLALTDEEQNQVWSGTCRYVYKLGNGETKHLLQPSRI